MSRRAVFLYNPVSGRGLAARGGIVDVSAELWRNAGYETEMVPTTAAGSATKQAAEIIGRGCDVLFACGGDGTVHEVMQTLVETKAPTALGVLPLGTGNVIANNLGLPHASPVAAAMQLQFVPRRIAVGALTSTLAGGKSESRYFLAAAGLGVHAKMLHQANSMAKNKGGMAAYYRAGIRLMFFEPFSEFSITLTLPDHSTVVHEAHELLAVKVEQFSGIVRRWRPGSSLLDPTLQMVMVKSKNRARLMTGTVRCMIGGNPRLHGVESVRATRAICRPIPSAGSDHIIAEADGEVVGSLPVEISVVPESLILLMPAS